MGHFWSPLRFSLAHNIKVIEAGMRLHNFITEHELEAGKKSTSSNGVGHDDEVLDCTRANPNEVIGVFGDEVNADNTGRDGSESAESKAFKKKGDVF